LISKIFELHFSFENLKGDESIDKIKLFIKEKERLDFTILNLQNQIVEYETELNGLENLVEVSNNEVIQADSEINKLTKTFEENVKFRINFSKQI
jgi:conjugal transfer/entry exclusion protein